MKTVLTTDAFVITTHAPRLRLLQQAEAPFSAFRNGNASAPICREKIRRSLIRRRIPSDFFKAGWSDVEISPQTLRGMGRFRRPGRSFSAGVSPFPHCSLGFYRLDCQPASS